MSHLDHLNRVHSDLIAILSDHGNDHFVISEVSHHQKGHRMKVTGNYTTYPKQQKIEVYISFYMYSTLPPKPALSVIFSLPQVDAIPHDACHVIKNEFGFTNMTLYGNTWRIYGNYLEDCRRNTRIQWQQTYVAIYFVYDCSLDLENADASGNVSPLILLASLFRGYLEAELPSSLVRYTPDATAFLMGTHRGSDNKSLVRLLKPELVRMILDILWSRILE